MSESKSPVLEPHTQVFFDALISQGGEPLYKLSYPAARKVLEDLQAAPVTKLPADVEDEVPVRIYRPQGGRRSLPAVMYFHGGCAWRPAQRVNRSGCTFLRVHSGSDW